MRSAFSSYTHIEITEIIACQVQCEEKVSGSLRCVLGVCTEREEALIYTNICQPEGISKSHLNLCKYLVVAEFNHVCSSYIKRLTV